MPPLEASAPTLSLEPNLFGDAISLWPSTPAWYVVFLVALIVLIVSINQCYRYWVRIRQQKKLQSLALVKLKNIIQAAQSNKNSKMTNTDIALNKEARSESMVAQLNTLTKLYLREILTDPILSQGDIQYNNQFINQLMTIYGSRWTDFMNTISSENSQKLLSSRVCNILAQGAYRPAKSLPLTQIEDELTRWIKSVHFKKIVLLMDRETLFKNNGENLSKENALTQTNLTIKSPNKNKGSMKC